MKPKLILLGKLTADAEVKTSKAGKPFCTANMACNYKIGEEKKTTFVKLITFNKSAEVFGKYGKKGCELFVEGEPKASGWKHRDTGEVQTALECVVTEFNFITWGNDRREPGDDTDQTNFDEVIPF